MTEISVLRPGSEDQELVLPACAKAGFDPALCRIDPGHLVEQYGGVPLAAQYGADRLGNVGRRQCRGRHLIEQRLEEVVIVPVNDRDLDRRPCQFACGFESAKPGADDNGARAIAPSSRDAARAIRHGCP